MLQGWCGAYPGAGELCLMPKASAKMMHHSQALYVFSVYVGACHTFFIASAPPRGCGVGWGGVGGQNRAGDRTDRHIGGAGAVWQRKAGRVAGTWGVGRPRTWL
jgi:hypothetical protein